MEINTESIVLGSGKLYYEEFNGSIPANTDIETDANLLGLISGGASLEYKPEYYTAEDDLGLVQKTIITKEEATLKSGVITWNGNTLSVLSSTARVTEAAGKRTVKIGGRGNDNGKSHVLHFVHEDEADGDVRVTIVGKNEAGFTIAFAKDKETVVDAEFKAKPHDTEGTLIVYEEEMVGAISVVSAAGSTTGKTAITVSPTIEDGHSYKYKAGASVEEPLIGESCTTGYTAWNGTDEITATTGQKIVIVEVDNGNIARKTGSATITSKA